MKKSTREHSEKTPKQVVRLEVGSFKANCYLLFDSKKNCVIIDPGDDAEFIEDKIRDLGLTPRLILATHGHSDHISAAGTLCLAYQIPFYMNRKDEFLFKRLKGIAPKIAKDLKEGDILRAGDIIIKVLAIPGHTPGLVAFKLEDEDIAFSGDLFFGDGSTGRYDFYYADKAALIKSIAKLKKLGRATRFFPGHGEEFSLL